MIKYRIHCFCCKRWFEVEEGTQKYKRYKENMNGKFACQTCEDKIYLEARANLFGKLHN